MKRAHCRPRLLPSFRSSSANDHISKKSPILRLGHPPVLRMLPGFPSLLARTAFASSASFSPLASRAVPRHGSPSFPPSPRFISIVDSKPIIPILSEAEQRSEQERAKLDPDVTRRREAILKEVKRAEEAKGNSGEVRLSFTVLGEEGVVKHPHLAYTKAEVSSGSMSLSPFLRVWPARVTDSRRSFLSPSDLLVLVASPPRRPPTRLQQLNLTFRLSRASEPGRNHSPSSFLSLPASLVGSNIWLHHLQSSLHPRAHPQG